MTHRKSGRNADGTFGLGNSALGAHRGQLFGRKLLQPLAVRPIWQMDSSGRAKVPILDFFTRRPVLPQETVGLLP